VGEGKGAGADGIAGGQNVSTPSINYWLRHWMSSSPVWRLGQSPRNYFYISIFRGAKCSPGGQSPRANARMKHWYGDFLLASEIASSRSTNRR
jgi:hypothetical protein